MDVGMGLSKSFIKFRKISITEFVFDYGKRLIVAFDELVVRNYFYNQVSKLFGQ